MTPDLEVVSLTKAFSGRTVLDDVSLRVNPGEFIAILGPSGSGKSTLLKITAGFEQADRGTVRLQGTDVTDVPPYRRNINTVFQSYALFPHLSVFENVAYGLRRKPVREPELSSRVYAALALVDLAAFGPRAPETLSGGEQQRIALARALVNRPAVLLLDEPLSALDLKLRKEMQGELKRLQRETGITFVLVTHDQEEALAMSDRIAVMSAGHVLQVGNPREIYDSPANRFVADFIGESNVLPGALLGRSADIMISVRPERISIAPAANDNLNPDGGGRARGRIESVTFLGLDTLYEVSLADNVRLRSRRRDAHPSLSMGSSVVVDWPDDVERQLAT